MFKWNVFRSTFGIPYSFTGCNTTSAFSGQGKTRPLNILGIDDEYIRAFRALNCCEDLSQHHKRIIESFVWHMYGKKDAHTQGITVKDLCYHIYSQKEGKVSCEHSFLLAWMYWSNTWREHNAKLEFGIHACNKKPALMHLKKTVGQLMMASLI